MNYRIAWAVVSLAAAHPLSAKEVVPTEIGIDAYAPFAVTIEAKPAQLMLSTGLIDRLTLNTAFVTANGIKPAPIMGNSNVSFWGRKEIKGKNRPLTMVVNGVKKNNRAFWFFDVPQPEFDGTIGPWVLPFDRINVRLGNASEADRPYEFPFLGDANNGSFSGYKEETFGTYVSFSVGWDLPYPLASAATGAAIATQYGGSLSGEEIQLPIAFGVKRPVRLMKLEKPFVVGPFSFSEIMVRTRSSYDSAGSGEAIAEAGENDENADPAEIVVIGTGKKAKKPSFTFDIGKRSLAQCSSMRFDKIAKTISMSCRPG